VADEARPPRMAAPPAGPPPADVAAPPPHTSQAIVSLNDVVLAVGELTSRQIRELVKVSVEGIAGVTSCGCDGGRCGCFGSDCPCNKVNSGFEDVVSLPEFLKEREQVLAGLRKQLQAFEADDAAIKRLEG
jgi:hypothetical protein